MEYCSPLWSPSEAGLTASLEKVQKLATRLVPGLKRRSYSQSLKTLGLVTLAYRRLRSDLILLFKLIRSDDPLKQRLFSIPKELNTRGHTLRLVKNHSRLKARSNFFVNRVVLVWNSLPEFVVNSSSVNSFKHNLNVHFDGLSLKFDPTSRYNESA